ncbi:MAG: hypothetical protein AAGI69_10470 [Cyanobacteria bacterium P01_H01_bin.21]
MSNSPELTPKTSSSAKNLLRRFKELITSPYGVAAIASLSFHGALFAAMPRFSEASFAAFNEENTEAEARTVPLVTLSAADQERLPDFNRPQLPAISNFNSAPPANLPNASTFNRSNIPNIFNRSGSSLTSPSLGSPNNLSRNRPFQNPYIPRPNLSIRNTPSRSARSSDNRTATIIDIPKPPPSILQGTETDEDTLRRQLEIEAQQQAAADQAEPAEGLPDLPEQSEEETDSENSEDIAANTETANQPTQLERLQAKFNYDETNTTPEEVEANYEDWETQTEENSDGAVETAELVELTLEPGFRLCAQNPPTSGAIGILVAPDGTPSDPTVLRSTGYEYLNKAAIETLMATEFPETEQAVRYPFEIIVNYDDAACKSAEEILETVQNTAEQPEAEQPEAEQPEAEQPEAE